MHVQHCRWGNTFPLGASGRIVPGMQRPMRPQRVGSQWSFGAKRLIVGGTTSGHAPLQRNSSLNPAMFSRPGVLEVSLHISGSVEMTVILGHSRRKAQRVILMTYVWMPLDNRGIRLLRRTVKKLYQVCVWLVKEPYLSIVWAYVQALYVSSHIWLIHHHLWCINERTCPAKIDGRVKGGNPPPHLQRNSSLKPTMFSRPGVPEVWVMLSLNIREAATNHLPFPFMKKRLLIPMFSRREVYFIVVGRMLLWLATLSGY